MRAVRSAHPQVPAHRRAQLIKDAGVHASVVLNPATSLHTLEEILPELHMVLLMSVKGSSQGAQLEVYTLHSPLNAIQKC